MKGQEIIGAQVVDPGTGANMSPATGNSFTIREGSGIRLVAMLSRRQTRGLMRITSPLLHDAVVGMQLSTGSAETRDIAVFPGQPLVSQDDLTVFATGATSGSKQELSAFTILYDDLSGADGQFTNLAGIKNRAIEHASLRQTLTPTVAGDWSGDQTIVADQDQLKANSEYAILGWTVEDDGSSLAVRFVCSDWANLGVGGPIHTNVKDAELYFLRLARFTQEDVIPVFNSSNKDLVTVSLLSDENLSDVVINVHLARLSSPTRRG